MTAKTKCFKCCTAFTVILACLITYCLYPPGVMDMTKSFELKNGQNCKLVDGPRGFEDQTYWNHKVMIST